MLPEHHQVNDQVNLESETLKEAGNRVTRDNYKSNKRQAWSESKLGISFHRQAAKRFSESVHAELGNITTGGGRGKRAFEKLRQTGLEPDVIAHLFTKALYNMIPLTHRRRVKRVSLCIKAADLIHDEWRIRHFAEQKNRKALLKKLFKTFDTRTYPRDWRKRTIQNAFHAEQISWQQWSDHDKLHVGYALLLLFRDHTGLIEAGPQSIFVEPVVTLVRAIEEAMTTRVLDFMIYQPMVVKPLPWSTSHLFRGGYLSTKKTRHYPIIKGSRRRDVERFASMDWSKVIPPLNALQEVPWRVNKDMLEILSWSMFVKGGGIAGIPHADAKPLPDEPPGYRTDEEVKKAHNKVCFLIHSFNREIKSKRLMVLATIGVAKRFRNFKEIYFPHNLDSRGRAYPLPAFLNPQGPDSCKGLLEFSEGKPITTEEQADWLAISGANAFGQDKISLKDRVAWVKANEEMILDIGANPKGDHRWMSVSEPFQALRFCLEWSAFRKQGYGFVSHMVTCVDGTCSGIQHYSALLLDSVGGRSVNLIPGLPRQDIYQDVADKTIEKLFRESNQFPAECANLIKFGVTRKTTKRQCMVVPYAGTFSSCMEYTREAVKERIEDGYPCPWNTEDQEEHNKHVVLLSKLIWEAIDETVVLGKEAMRWLSSAAREYAKHVNKVGEGTAYDKRMAWTTPDGFEAIHYRADEKKRQVDTYLDGRVSLTYMEATNKMDVGGLSLAVAPNLIHSYDANLMRASILKGLEVIDNPSFAMVHDSFGVHAADMPVFVKLVKEAFVEMYQQPLLEQFKDNLPPEVQEKLEPLPVPGDLDLNGVLESEFFVS